MRAGPAGPNRAGQDIGPGPAGDKGLPPVDPVDLPFLNGPGSDGPHVRSGIRFGDGQGADLLPGQDRGDQTLFQVFPAGTDDRRKSDIQRTQSGRHSPGPAAGDFLDGGHFQKQIAFGPAERFRVADTQDTGLSGPAVQLPGELPLFLPFVDVREDLPFNELSDRLPDQVVGFPEIFLIGHGKKATLLMKIE